MKQGPFGHFRGVRDMKWSKTGTRRRDGFDFNCDGKREYAGKKEG
jgi:hypothetical protein